MSHETDFLEKSQVKSEVYIKGPLMKREVEFPMTCPRYGRDLAHVFETKFLKIIIL